MPAEILLMWGFAPTISAFEKRNPWPVRSIKATSGQQNLKYWRGRITMIVWCCAKPITPKYVRWIFYKK